MKVPTIYYLPDEDLRVYGFIYDTILKLRIDQLVVSIGHLHIKIHTPYTINGALDPILGFISSTFDKSLGLHCADVYEDGILILKLKPSNM